MLLLTTNYAFADGDLWDNFGDTNVYGQKPVSDEEFDKALESKQKRKNVIKIYLKEKNSGRATKQTL